MKSDTLCPDGLENKMSRILALRTRNLIKITFLSMTLISLSSCGMTDKMQRLVIDAADNNSRHINTELQYTEFELHWQKIEFKNSDEFKNAFSQKLSKEMDRRAPKALQGNQLVHIVLTVSDVYNPGALARGFAFQNPSIKITAVVRDLSTGKDIFTREFKIVDVLPPDFSTAIQFRIGSIPDRLAVSFMSSLIDWLRKL